ncbi:MAG: ABC-2 family transporter protein [Patescibacteria group bacterium]
MFVKTLHHEWAVAVLSWRTNLRAALENRIAFGLQVFGMMINDSAFVAVWAIFFTTFGTVNGWDVWDSVGLLGFGTITFGLAFAFFGGAPWINKYVADASFDGILLSPNTVLWRVLTSKTDVAALGDAVFGLILLVLYAVKIQATPEMIGMMFLAIIPGAAITVAMSILSQLPAFFLLDGDSIAMSLYKSFLSPSLYPSALYSDAARIFYTVVIPSILVGGIPVEIVRSQNWLFLLGLWIAALVWVAIAILAFYTCLKKYESGNAIGLRSAN